MSNMVAAGAYIRTLREALGLSRDEIAHRAGTNGAQLFRIEKGEVDTRSSLLMTLVKLVRGSADQIARLITDDGATAEDGQRLALSWMSEETKAEVDYFIENASNEEIAELMQVLNGIIREKGPSLPLRVLKALRGA